MLWTIFVLLLVLWLLGVVSSYTLGGFIHILLILAIAVVLIRVNPTPICALPHHSACFAGAMPMMRSALA